MKDIVCNIDIDGCIEMYKETKAEVEAMGNPDSEPTQNLVETFDNKIQQLEANMRHEKETIAWEYGRCVFYDKTPIQVCNSVWGPDGLKLYEERYGDGSWTFDSDPNALSD